MRRRVLVFGTFDGCDLGHQLFLSAARKKGSELIAVVARDTHGETLKQKKPRYNEQDRLTRVKEDLNVSDATFSDEELGTYEVVTRIHPHVIVLGFDQIALEQDLRRWMQKTSTQIDIVVLSHFEEHASNV